MNRRDRNKDNQRRKGWKDKHKQRSERRGGGAGAELKRGRDCEEERGMGD